MDPDPCIVYVSKIDFSKGFQSFHIKWLFGKVENICSSIFEVLIADGDKNKKLSWKLGISSALNQPNSKWFGIYNKSPVVVPASCRVSILNAKQEILLCESFACFEKPNRDGLGVAFDSEKLAGLTDNDLVMRFDLMVPKAIGSVDQILAESQSNCSTHKLVNNGLQSWAAKMINSVLSGERSSISDVTLVVVEKEGDGPRTSKVPKLENEFHCHTVVLVASSPVFEHMFDQEWKENANKMDRKVEIKDFDKKTMEIMLRFMYSGKVPDDSIGCDQLSEVISAANYYQMDNLKDYCVSIMMSRGATRENRVKQLILADQFNLKQLKAVCLAHLCLFVGDWDQKMIEQVGWNLFKEIQEEVKKHKVALMSLQ